MVRAREEAAKVEAYRDTLGWGSVDPATNTVTVEVNGEARTRVLDIRDERFPRAVEHKSGYTYVSPEVDAQVAFPGVV